MIAVSGSIHEESEIEESRDIDPISMGKRSG